MNLANLPRPEPSAGLEAYEAERAACLALDPLKAANWKRYQARQRTAKVDYLPPRLDIENVSRCNLRCTMCAVAGWPKGQRARDMTLAEFKALIDSQAGLVEIKLNGLGEALMQGGAYFDMIRYARARRIWVRMTTNATLLHLHANAQKLVDADVNEVDISIDGADRATYSAIRVGGVFERVLQNCLDLNRHFAARGLVRTKMWTLVQRANAANLEAHVALAARIGFRHLVFSLQLHGWGDERLAARNKAEEVGPGLDEARLLALVARGASLGVRVSFWSVAEKFSTANPETLCPWPFDRAVVTSDRRTVPCCMIGDPDKFEIARGKSFTEAWQGEEYAEFRRAHLEGRVPAVCKGCYA